MFQNHRFKVMCACLLLCPNEYPTHSSTITLQLHEYSSIPVRADIHMGVVGTHVAHNTAKLTMDGEYTHARLNAMSSQRLLQRTRLVCRSKDHSLGHMMIGSMRSVTVQIM